MIALLIAAAFAAAPAAPSACGARIQGFNIYEELVDGIITEKHSVDAIGEWSAHTAYEGFVIKKNEDPATKLIVEFRKTLNGKTVRKFETDFKVWEKDANLLAAQNFDPQKIIGETAGSYSVSLNRDGKVLCRDTFAVIDAD